MYVQAIICHFHNKPVIISSYLPLSVLPSGNIHVKALKEGTFQKWLKPHVKVVFTVQMTGEGNDFHERNKGK